MKKIKVKCPYCGGKASLHSASYVYGKVLNSDALLYVCDKYPRCDSYVAAHSRTKLPMGSLANGDLRYKRIQAHKTFDLMWKSGLMTKRQAYKWMEGKLSLSASEAHIGNFREYMCDRLISECNRVYANNNMLFSKKERVNYEEYSSAG